MPIHIREATPIHTREMEGEQESTVSREKEERRDRRKTVDSCFQGGGGGRKEIEGEQ